MWMRNTGGAGRAVGVARWSVDGPGGATVGATGIGGGDVGINGEQGASNENAVVTGIAVG